MTYDRTPSFYNNEETFKKYLGLTSYYQILQSSVCKIIMLAKPKEVLEMGFGTGETTFRLAKENSHINFTSVDLRKEMIDLASEYAKNEAIHNVEFVHAEMVEYVQRAAVLPDFLLFLYSFHHIEDPLEKKNRFLAECYNKMPQDGYLCIAETFLPETTDNDLFLKAEICKLWADRVLEGYASTFWASLNGLKKEEIDQAKQVGHFSFEFETKAGTMVEDRNEEYLVKVSWLCKTAKSIGYEIIITEPCNNVGDHIVLLKKSTKK